MQNQKTDDSSGACLSMGILVGFVGFMLYTFGRWIYDTWLFFHRPDALARVIEFFQAIGLCCGAAILFVIILWLIPSSWMASLTGISESSSDDDDNYQN